jgi:multiple sugar transport system substrate-binding protein
MPFLGDYYQVTSGWAEARTAWWNMLQQVGAGADVTEAVAAFCETANAAAQG